MTHDSRTKRTPARPSPRTPPPAGEGNITGAILAGGASSRMGRPKQDIRLPDGRTMIQAIAGTMAHVCDQIVIVGESEGLPELIRVKDLRPGLGPLGGIEALLASGIDKGGQYLVCPCDVPLMTAAALRWLLRPSPAPATIVQLADRAQPESLPARLSAAALPTVRTLLDSGQRALWALMQALPAEIVPISAEWEKCFRNVNTLQELKELR